jgi:hypothetical protein
MIQPHRLCSVRHRAVLAALLLGIATNASARQQMATVSLPVSAQTAQGVELAALQPADAVDLADAVASVRDVSPLLATAANLASVQAQVRADAAAAAAARAEAARLQALLGKGYVALRDVQSANATAAAAQATHTADIARFAALRADARAQWGEVLAVQAARGPTALADYADGRASLVELALPDEPDLAPAAQITLHGPAVGSVEAHLLGAAPSTDAVVQGASWFYRADAGGLRSGQRLAVRMALAGNHAAAVQVPREAVVWYAGQPWVYVERAPGQFQRVPLPARTRGEGGWIVDGALHAGQRVVVRGGELLLTQELKPPPGTAPAGGDDDDD